MAESQQPCTFELYLKLGKGSGITETALQNRQILVAAYEAMLGGD